MICGALVCFTAVTNHAVTSHANETAQSGPLAIDAATSVDVTDISAWLREIPLKSFRPGILPEEAELYYQVLDFAATSDTAAVKSAAQDFLTQRWEQSKYARMPFDRFPVFVDMYKHPQAYQGRPITLSGHVQRTVVSAAGPNEFGIDQLCEIWLYTDDSQSNPTVVLATELPAGFPVGEQPVDRVTVTGYIYRMYTYEARDAARFAPLLMANRVDWVAPELLGENDRSWLVLTLLGLLILIGCGCLARIILKRTSQNPARVPRKLPETLVFEPDARSEVKFPGSSS